MRKKLTMLCLFALPAMGTTAQEIDFSELEVLRQKTETLQKEVSKLKKLKISGYLQAQYQYGEKEAVMKIGTANENPEKSFSRFGIRRGRIKFTYEEGIASGVFQLDITEKGIGVKDAYLNLLDPWFRSMALRAGVFDRPFGNEIGFSSSRRESPERSTIFQTLFPDERDLGAMLILQAPKNSPWSILKLEAGLFAGNGIEQETDNRRDFIGHLSLANTFDCSFAFGAGVSYYNGSVYQGTEKVYTMSGGGFRLDDETDNRGRFAKREYVGFDAQFAFVTPLGETRLRGEYLFGQQPGSAHSSKSPNASQLPATDTYIRHFSGGYLLFVQELGRSPFSAVAKYDWYDPNSDVSRDEVGANGTGKADLTQETFGFGALWQINSALRLQAYYEIPRNEKSNALEGFGKELKNNLFTLRLQYKF